MSERMNNETAKDQIKEIRQEIKRMLDNFRHVFDDTFSDDDIQALDIATECIERKKQIEKIINDVFSIQGLNQCNAEMYIALEKIKEIIE